MPTLVSFKLLFIEMTRSVLLMAVHLLVGKKKRTVFDHQRAANALDDDYLGTGVIPRFDDRQFELQFGINRARFTEIMEQLVYTPINNALIRIITSSGYPFYVRTRLQTRNTSEFTRIETNK